MQQTRRSSMNDDKNFSVSLDVRHYNPDEVHLKIEGNSLVVYGKHHHEGEDGFETSEFQKSYTLPEDVCHATLTSKINPDGVLQIEAVRKQGSDRGSNVGADTLKIEGDCYSITIPTGNYKPEEITVKVKGRQVTLEGHHGEHLRHRQFHRTFVLPTDGDMDAIQSKIQSDGTLLIRVPRKKADVIKERVVPIVFERRDEKDDKTKQ